MGNRSKKLSELALTARGGANPEITGLAVDSREVKDGFLFAALPGTRVHGGDFIQYALRMKAGAILTDREGAAIAADVLTGDVPVVIVEDPREALAFTADLWFEAQPEVQVAVTGTPPNSAWRPCIRSMSRTASSTTVPPDPLGGSIATMVGPWLRSASTAVTVMPANHPFGEK